MPKGITIMGAGPAGLTAAIVLARAGVPVTVYDRASHVGADHDGDLEAIENFTTRDDLLSEFERWGLRPNFHCAPMHELTCLGPGFATKARVADDTPMCYVIARGTEEGTLDRGLLAQAREAGARVEFKRTARPEEVDIIAGGVPRPGGYALGFTFETSAPDVLCACLDEEITPNVYSYLIICGGRGTVGLGALARQKGMKQALERVVSGFRSRLGFDMTRQRFFSGTGAFGLPEMNFAAPQMRVGEAANLQDPLFFFGVRLSMTTGHLAARSVLDGQPYSELWRKRCMPLFQAAAVNRMILGALGQRGHRALIWYARMGGDGGRALMHRHYHPLPYTRPLWPLARARLRGTARPSAVELPARRAREHR